MPHHYHSLQGWFDFDNIYNLAVSKFNYCQFIEIGCFQGKSACFLAEKIKESDKQIQVICIDLWPTKRELDVYKHLGSGQGVERDDILKLDQNILDVFISNMIDAKVDDYIIPIKSSSEKAWNVVKNGKYPFIFIDAGHSYEQVKKDLELYYPLVSEGGICAGHDFYNETERGVLDFFGPLNLNVERHDNSWLVNKP